MRLYRERTRRPHHCENLHPAPAVRRAVMSQTLKVKFNHRSADAKRDKRGREIKSEEDFAVGKFNMGDGRIAQVRAGKIIGVSAPKTEKHHAKKLNEFRLAASEAVARKHKAARAHHKP